MSMTKIIDPSGWDWGRPVAQLVKVSSRGLVGQDRRDFIKLAGHTAPAFLGAIDRVKLAADEVALHLLALGASEYYGCNRNGDGFKEAHCRRHHQTFEKFARFYRNHANKNPAASYGTVKASAYNDAMHRVELLVGLNATKEAADRNGGLVADKELEKLAKDEIIPVSMACRIQFDVCSGCDNRARTRAEYCTADTCKYGGCRDNLTKVAADGHILHVDNPDPVWFDISNVYRPADRIAYGARADWLEKAAAHAFVGGAEMAEHLGVTAPLHVCLASDAPADYDDSVRGQYKLASGLAALETLPVLLRPATARAFGRDVRAELSDDQLSVIGRPGTEKAAAALGALAEQKVFLALRDFARWTGKSASVDGASRLLPGVYRKLASGCGGLGARLAANPYAASTKAASLAQRTLARNLVVTHSLASDAVADRAMLSCLRNAAGPDPKNVFWDEKVASDDPSAAALAEDYALYQLAALTRVAGFDRDFNLTARLALGQNRV